MARSNYTSVERTIYIYNENTCPLGAFKPSQQERERMTVIMSPWRPLFDGIDGIRFTPVEMSPHR